MDEERGQHGEGFRPQGQAWATSTQEPALAGGPAPGPVHTEPPADVSVMCPWGKPALSCWLPTDSFPNQKALQRG